MTEAAIQQQIRLALGAVPGLRIFRNNVGALRDQYGRLVSYGLHPGSADLIGWRSVIISPEMVGTAAAIFLSIEVKSPSGQPRADQIAWADAVRGAGGFAGVARSPEQAKLIARLHEPR